MSTLAPFRHNDIPSKPGVYFFRNQFGDVIYVGKAKNLRKRLATYFQPSRRKTADPRIRSLINSIASFQFQAVASESEALILESKLIKRYAPRYNVLLRDDKRFLLVKIDSGEPFPRLRLARVRNNDGQVYFGPFPKGGVLRDTVDFLNKRFKIRVCSPRSPGESDRRHCLARIVKDCSEPCVGKISPEDYHDQIENLLKVMRGDIKEIIVELEAMMTAAADKKNYEKAAKLRDMIHNIEEICGRRGRNFRFATLPSSAPGADAVEDLRAALGLEAAPKIIEAFDNSNLGGSQAVSSMVRFENGRPARSKYRRFRVKTVRGADDFATMNEIIGRHYSRRLAEKKELPDLILIDGGKGQLNAAIKALLEIGHPPLPIIGLAKRDEEIFLPGCETSLKLDKNRPALKLLRAVRDEAHRFAVAYHREIRGKRLTKSLLDDIPGIGPHRKNALLKAFGSVRELKKADAAAITAKVPGIGARSAERIVAALRRDATHVHPNIS